MRKLCFGTAAALMAYPLLALPASAAPCASGSVSSYEAAGFSCSVGGVTFSDINVNTLVSGGGSVELGNFTPISTGTEFGLSLNYTASAPTNGSADVAWTYNVAGSLLDDVTMAFAGTTTGNGSQSLSEVLSNGITLSLNSAGSTGTTFTPIASLGVIKDQANLGNSDGSANASIVTNEFSVTSTTPLPATLPLFATGLLGLWGVRKRRNKQNSATAA